MTERQWQAQVEGLARYYGWLIYHAPDNRPGRNGRVQRVTAGFPDLVMVRGPELLFAELKTGTGRVAPAQREWLQALEVVRAAVAAANAVCDSEGVGPHPAPAVEVHVWRPDDWDTLHARLAKGRARVESVNRPAAP